MTTVPSPTDFLGDPLSPVSRKARRDLLIASIVGILVSSAGLVPTRISALGIDLSLREQGGFTLLVMFVVLYFLGTFVLYGTSDYFVWRKRYQDYLEQMEVAAENWSEADQLAHDERRKRLPDIGWLWQRSKAVAFCRSFFEFGLPPIVGLCATSTLLLRLIHR